MIHYNISSAFVQDLLPPPSAAQYKTDITGPKYYLDKVDNKFIVKVTLEDEFIIPMFPFTADLSKGKLHHLMLKSVKHGFPPEINDGLETLILHLVNIPKRTAKKASILDAYDFWKSYALIEDMSNGYMFANKNKNMMNYVDETCAFILKSKNKYHDNLIYDLERRFIHVDNFPENTIGFSPDAEFFGLLAEKNYPQSFGAFCINNFTLVELDRNAQ